MPCNTKKSVYTLDKIQPPQHPIIFTIWEAFNQISFSVPVQNWLTPDDLYQPALPAIKVWRLNPKSSLELLAGFRSYNLASACGLSEIEVIEYTALSEIEAIDIALKDILYPLVLWNCCTKNSNLQILHFLKTVRKSLPVSYKKQLPKHFQLREWLNISEYTGRKRLSTPSKLTLLRQSISSRQENVQQEPAKHGQA